jgi:hypothetical protein
VSKSQRRQAREEILAKYPVETQLSAICEAQDGDSTALDAIVAGVGEIKRSYPALNYDPVAKRNTKVFSKMSKREALEAAAKLVSAMPEGDTKKLWQYLLTAIS